MILNSRKTRTDLPKFVKIPFLPGKVFMPEGWLMHQKCPVLYFINLPAPFSLTYSLLISVAWLVKLTICLSGQKNSDRFSYEIIKPIPRTVHGEDTILYTGQIEKNLITCKIQAISRLKIIDLFSEKSNPFITLATPFLRILSWRLSSLLTKRGMLLKRPLQLPNPEGRVMFRKLRNQVCSPCVFRNSKQILLVQTETM